ncbi:hypothetical protein P12x_000847 [Tundrisphaera lichenicola]|uniref:hypothetical protein n=1 Tax=Tundrisphaera lichenicola TaxID=2029860 RepID=UPI003EBEF924
MIEDEIDGIVPTSDKSNLITVSVSAGWPEMREDFRLDVVDAEEALVVFDNFPWDYHRKEYATRVRLSVEGDPPWICYNAASSHIIITATEEQDSFDVELCVPSDKKFLGIIKYHKFYSFKCRKMHRIKAMISCFFEDLQGNWRASNADVYDKYNKLSRSIPGQDPPREPA